MGMVHVLRMVAHNHVIWHYTTFVLHEVNDSMYNNSPKNCTSRLSHVNPTYDYMFHACNMLIIIHTHHAPIPFQVGAMDLFFPMIYLFEWHDPFQSSITPKQLT